MLWVKELFGSEMSEDGIVELVLRGKVIDCGEVGISRSTPDKARGRPRYLIYLPIARNYLWELLWKKKVKVRVLLQVLEAESIHRERAD